MTTTAVSNLKDKFKIGEFGFPCKCLKILHAAHAYDQYLSMPLKLAIEKKRFITNADAQLPEQCSIGHYMAR